MSSESICLIRGYPKRDSHITLRWANWKQTREK
jgi:hypothetical protein